MTRVLYLVLGLILLGGVAWHFLPEIAGLVGFCSNDVVAEAPSPSGRKKAVVFTRSCGATTSYGTNLSILSRDQRNPAGPGNLFLAEWNKAAKESGVGRTGPPVRIVWRDDRHLVVTYDSRAKVWFQKREIKGVRVDYQQKQPQADSSWAARLAIQAYLDRYPSESVRVAAYRRDGADHLITLAPTELSVGGGAEIRVKPDSDVVMALYQ